MPQLTEPPGVYQDIEWDRLLLDSANLRLLEHVSEELLETPADQIGTEPIQDRLLTTIRDEPRFKLDSLMKSIRSLTFLKNDRLIVARYDGSRYLVLEGNRRLSAVRSLMRTGSATANVLDSMQFLPCFVLSGPPISGSEEQLEEYRSEALEYIGVRHLTGIQQWEPASRYEFLARLIDKDHMSPQEVSDQFGIPLSAVLRDYRGHLLYRNFREFEESKGLRKHRLTYNTFAEASRSPDIRNWLGWSDQTQKFDNQSHINIFFEYVITQLGIASTGSLGLEDEDWTPEDSAEAVVRRFRDMLKRKDDEIESNLEQEDFAKAHELFDVRKLGKLEQRLKGYINGIKSVSKSEMRQNPSSASSLLEELAREALDLKSITDRLG